MCRWLPQIEAAEALMALASKIRVCPRPAFDRANISNDPDGTQDLEREEEFEGELDLKGEFGG